MKKLLFTLTLASLVALPGVSLATDLPIYDKGKILTTPQKLDDPRAIDDFLSLYKRPGLSFGFTTTVNRELLIGSQNYRFAEGISGLMLGIGIEFDTGL